MGNVCIIMHYIVHGHIMHVCNVAHSPTYSHSTTLRRLDSPNPSAMVEKVSTEEGLFNTTYTTESKVLKFFFFAHASAYNQRSSL